jgi:hypothetical protein
MNALRTVLVVATLCLGATALAGEPDVDSPLLSWLGKFPSDAPIAKGGTLLQQPGLRKTLKALLPAPEAKRLGEFDTEAPVRRVDDYLVVDKCRPHACPADAAMIVIDLRSDRLWAGFFTRNEAGVATRWYGNRDDWNALPPAIVTDFLKRHGSIAP